MLASMPALSPQAASLVYSRVLAQLPLHTEATQHQKPYHSLERVQYPRTEKSQYSRYSYSRSSNEAISLQKPSHVNQYLHNHQFSGFKTFRF